jgi:hypothetical protein
MVTVWEVFQLLELKVRLAGKTVPSAVLLLVKPRMTSAVGWLFRRMSNVAIPPNSLVLPLIGRISNPAVSLSVMVKLPVVVVPN